MDSSDSIGKILAETRKNQGKSIPEMESLTKIRSKYLQALENDQFQLLPGEAYVKGFLRTYASCLDLDVQALLEKYKLNSLEKTETKGAKRPPLSSSTSQRRQRRTRSKGGIFLSRLILTLFILTLLIMLIFLGERESPASKSSSDMKVSQTNV